MAYLHVEQGATINAPAADIYAIISDYWNGHPRILPPEAFSDLVVEQGGVGAGTTATFKARMAGTTRIMRMQVEEPQPGRVLTEVYPDTGMRTSFILTPLDGGKTQVKITTDWQVGGIGGLIQKLVVPGMLKKVYIRELALLAEVVAERQAVA